MDKPDYEMDEVDNEADEINDEGDERDNEVDEPDNEVEEMDDKVEESGNGVNEMVDSSDITRIWINFLGKWYEILIDWNDSCRYKQEQVIRQLAEITGIPIEITSYLTLHEVRPLGRVIENRHDIRWIPIENNVIFNISPYLSVKCPNRFTKRNILGPFIAEGEAFYLAYTFIYETQFLRRTAISYELVPEVDVVEGECNLHMCAATCTEPFFNRIKRILLNTELNRELSLQILPILDDDHDWEEEVKKVYKKYNILQFFDVVCSYRFPEENP